MRSSSSSLLVVSLLALAAAACGSSGSSSPPGAEPGTPGDPNNPDAGPGADGGGPKAPSVPGPAANEELTEKFGVFVAPTGTDNADGTRAHPLARIQPAIDLAKAIGKRVYVCTGVYREALVLSDSISVIGGLDCSNADAWRTGAPRSRVESPTSPALTAKDITSPTRLEALDVVSPSATAPGASSIGLHAERANALVVASSKIAAGAGVKGNDGTDGIQLVNGPAINGGFLLEARDCTTNGNCAMGGVIGYYQVPGGAGGSNTCVAPGGSAPENGATGGTGGVFEVRKVPGPETFVLVLAPYNSKPTNEAGPPAVARTGTDGTDGTDGALAEAAGAISADGYAPADGSKGADGAAGKGGAGGTGVRPDAPFQEDHVYRGWAGAGGGAGGCPGVAGTPGSGGGASIAALLIESAVTFDTSELASAVGGQGGLGTFGSEPTAGGAAGLNTQAATRPKLNAQPGGRGGAAGVSTNGGNGPSLAIAHKGTAPVIKGKTVLKPGAPVPAIDARSRDTLGVTKTIPATPAGLSKDILAL